VAVALVTRSLTSLISVFAALFDRTDVAEVALLLEQIRILQEKIVGRFVLEDRDRRALAIAAHGIPRKRLEELSTLVGPDTLLRWYRRLVAEKYTTVPTRKPVGRPPIDAQIERAIVRLAKDNRNWGYRRIVGEMKKLGWSVAKSTVERVLQRNALEPVSGRERTRTWAELIRAQMAHLAAADFVTVEALTPRGLVRYLVFFSLKLESREVHVAGIRAVPDSAWMEQLARDLTDPEHGFLRDKNKLIIDQDPLYTHKFRALLKSGGIEAFAFRRRAPT